MNYSLLDKIVSADGGFLATILKTEGHTYRKAGARALFYDGDPIPVHGNLGSLCADQEIVDAGRAACRAARPRVVRIDTTGDDDADLGYGTFCGGVMEVLIEPVAKAHRSVYSDVRARLERGEVCHLVHDLVTGDLAVTDEAAPGAERYVEAVTPPWRVVLFGATPLARRLAAILDDSEFDVHITDWRSAFLERCEHLDARCRHLDSFPVARGAFAVIVSHSYRRDQEALRAALDADCAFVGLLSSRPRRERMFAELAAAGVAPAALARVSSPVGLDLGSRDDAEIAVAIAAEVIRAVRR